MARVFVTGTADGLGQMAARLLVADGHRVVLHARSVARAREAMDAVSGADGAVVGDLSSIAETNGAAEQVNALGDLEWKRRPWDGSQAYADTKLHDVILAFAIARLWPTVLSNALEPGWVPTKMGGPSAPDDLDKGPETQAWLAVSGDPAALVTDQYFFHKHQHQVSRSAKEPDVQQQLLDACAKLSGVALPE